MKTRTLNIILWSIAIVWTIGAVIAGIYLVGKDVPLTSWMTYYKWFIFIGFGWAVICVILFTVGGIYDLIALLRELNKEVVDVTDDGQVHDNEDQVKP